MTNNTRSSISLTSYKSRTKNHTHINTLLCLRVFEMNIFISYISHDIIIKYFRPRHIAFMQFVAHCHCTQMCTTNLFIVSAEAGRM